MEIPTKKRWFGLAYTAPLSVRIRSRQGCTYMYQIMKVVGWIPPSEIGWKRFFYFLWTFIVFFVATAYVPFGLYINIFKNFNSFTLGELLGLLQVALNNVGVSAKAIIIITLFSQFAKTELILDKLDERRQSDKDRLKIHRIVAISNALFVGCSFLTFGCIFSFLISGYLNGQPPFMVYNPVFDWHNGSAQFWGQCLLEYLFGTISVTDAFLEDVYALEFVLIFRGHIDLLKDHIRDLRTDLTKTEYENYEDLRNCIIDHKLILEYELYNIIHLYFYTSYIFPTAASIPCVPL